MPPEFGISKNMIKKLIQIYFLVLPFAPFFAYYLQNSSSEGLFYYNYGFIGLVLLSITFLTNFDTFRVPKYLIPLFFLFFYYFIWDLNNGIFDELGIISYFYRNITLYSIIILLLIENTSFDHSFLRKMINLFKVIIIVGFVFTMVQVLKDQYFFMPEKLIVEFREYGYSIWSRRHSSIFAYLGPNELGLSFMPILSLYIGFHSKDNRNRWFVFFLFLGIIVAIASNARYVFLSLIIILLQFFLMDKRLIGKLKYILVFFIVGYVLQFVFSAIGYDLTVFFNQRLMSQSSNMSRFISFDVFIQLFPNHILFGAGKEITIESTIALHGAAPMIHIGYLLHLYAFGLLGSLLLFSFWGLLLKKMYMKAIVNNYWGPFFAFIVFLFANTTLPYTNIFTFGLILSFLFYKNFEIQNKI